MRHGRRPPALLLALLFAWLPASAAAAQGGPAPPAAGDDGTKGHDAPPEPLPGEPRCGWCSTTGKVPFELDRKFSAESDAGEGWKVEFCSEAAEDGNYGLDWIPCARCKTPSLQARAMAEYDAVKQAADAWLKDRRKVDRVVGADKPLVHVRTTHFTICTDVPKLVTEKKQVYRMHELAHLYAQRLEDFYTRYRQMFGVEEQDNIKHHHFLYLFDEQEQAWLCGPVYTGLQGLPSVKRAGGVEHESTVVTWWDKGEYPKDTDMYRHQLHNFTHQFTSVYYNPSWFPPNTLGLMPPWLNDKYGWLDEGLAHWFEMQHDGIANTYCFREQNVTSRWGSNDWRKNVFKAVGAGDVPSFADVTVKATQSLSAKEHQFAWSWVDFLLAQGDPKLMGQAMRKCKEKEETRDIIKDVWGLTALNFESSWSAWVLENYAPNAKR